MRGAVRRERIRGTRREKKNWEIYMGREKNMENPYGDMKERNNLGIHVGERQRDRIGASIRGEIQDWIS